MNARFHDTHPAQFAAMTGSAFERGSAGKLVNQIRMLAKEERTKQNAASGSHSVNMHAYAANRLEAVLLAFGVSKDWPNSVLNEPRGDKS